MIDEKPVQEGIQVTLRDMDEFAEFPGSVVINVWDIFDRPIIEGPFALIENSDNFLVLQDTVSEEAVWEIPVTIMVGFDDWDSSRNALRELRSAVCRAFVGEERSPGTSDTTPVNVVQIRNDGPITEIRQAYAGRENEQDSLPLYVAQTLIFEAQQET